MSWLPFRFGDFLLLHGEIGILFFEDLVVGGVGSCYGRGIFVVRIAGVRGKLVDSLLIEHGILTEAGHLIVVLVDMLLALQRFQVGVEFVVWVARVVGREFVLVDIREALGGVIHLRDLRDLGSQLIGFELLLQNIQVVLSFLIHV